MTEERKRLLKSRYFAMGSLLLPLCAGVALRLWGLGRQVLGGDELHVLRALLVSTWRETLTTYRTADPCLPLSGLYRALLEAGVPLTEWTLRLPVLLAGLASILVLPWCLRPWVDRRTRTVFAWLLALSPLLVLYSRIARPYAIIMLLSFVALVAFLRWWQGAAWRLGWLYALLASLCGYFHLVTLPLLAAPFAFATADLLLIRRSDREEGGERRRERSRGWADLWLLGIATLAALALWLVPASSSLRRLLESKSGAGRIDFDVVLPTLQQQMGTSLLPVALGLFAVALFGGWRLYRAHGRCAAFVLTALIVQVVGLAFLAPLGLERSVILNRYLLPLTPWLLLGLAAGACRLWDLLAARLVARWPRVPLVRGVPLPGEGPTGEFRKAGFLAALLLAAGLLVLVAVSPFVVRPGDLSAGISSADFYLHSSFVHHRDALVFEEPLPWLPGEFLPDVYRQVRTSAKPADEVLEVPVRQAWRFARAVYVYQRFHGQPVRAGTFEQGLCLDRWSLRNLLCARRDEADALILDVERLRELGVRFLIVHLDPEAEELALLRELGRPVPRERRDPDRWDKVEQEAWELFRAFRRRWGKPHVREETIAMWDLSRLDGGDGR